MRITRAIVGFLPGFKKIKVQFVTIKVQYIFSIDLPCACVLWVGVTSSCMYMLAMYKVQLNEMLILIFDFMFSNVGWRSR